MLFSWFAPSSFPFFYIPVEISRAAGELCELRLMQARRLFIIINGLVL